MELKEAVKLLKDHNVWRRYDGEIGEGQKMASPKDLGIAIDKVVSEFENLFISDVIVPKGTLCDHKWVDARNIAVQSGKVCVKCHNLKA